MVGDMDGPISGAIGEGMSDAIAAVMTDDDTIGEWAANRAAGIRRYAYKNYPLKLKDFSGSSPHRDGEIYAAAIWRTYELFKANGKSRDLLMDYLIDGLNNTAPGPDFMQMRDGLLAAASGADDCLIWKAFAQFGMGQGSSMRMSSGRPVINSSTSVPGACSGSTTTSAPSQTSPSGFPQEGVWYSLKNAATGAILDTDPNGRLDLYSGNGMGDDRRWRFVKVSKGVYRIINGKAGRGQLDSAKGGVVRWISTTNSNNSDHLWRIETLSDGKVRFENLYSGREYLSARWDGSVNWNSNNNAKWVPKRVN
jgi:hypothetical protein